MQRLVMHLGLVLAVALGASCWRESPPPPAPTLSFVARVNALAELRRGTQAIARRMELTMQRILGLASEAEREAVRADVAALERDVAHLIRVLETARDGGEDPALLAGYATTLRDARVRVAQLREDVQHARTLEEQEAFERLKRKLEGTHDPGDPHPRIYWQRGPTMTPRPPMLPDAPILPP
jgi:hypothetical protein